MATFRSLIGPQLSAVWQRRWVWVLALLMPSRSGVSRVDATIDGLSVQIVTPKHSAHKGAILYLHGGAFCLGSAHTHRSICSHLAYASALPVWVPNYRLAPEHPYPCALDDALATYNALLRSGLTEDQIVISGDSAGASLALALAIRLQQTGRTAPAGLVLISPVTDMDADRSHVAMTGRGDPMITQDWLRQGIAWFNAPKATPEFSPLNIDLHGLPPMLIQAGEEEILLSDSVKLTAHAEASGVECRLEVYQARWHVFHLQTFYLHSSKKAVMTMATFIRMQLQRKTRT